MFIFCKTNLLGNLSTNAILVNMRTTLYPKKSPIKLYLNTSMASPASRKPAIQVYIPSGCLGCLTSSSLSLVSLLTLTIPTGAVMG